MHIGSLTTSKSSQKTTFILGIVFLAALTLQSVPFQHANAATTLLNRRDRLSSGTVGVSADHLIKFTITDFASPVGSIRIEFCGNSPIEADVCLPPNGLDATGAVLSQQVGETGFSIHANSDANNIILTRPASNPTTGDVTYELQGIMNPADPGTFYLRIQTYSSLDGTGIPIQFGGIALAVNRQFVVATEVPPFLRFCAGVTIVAFDCSSANSFLIDLGEFSPNQTKYAQSEMVAATNAPFGFNISLSGTTLTSGNNIIDSLPVQSASVPGTSQFGVNLRANTSPSIGANPTGPGVANPTAAYNTPNQYRFQPGDVVASSSAPNDYRKFTVSYIANIDADQAPGVYATTISFICLANF